MTPSPPPSTLIIGATGPTGALILQRALAEGVRVTALARDPARLSTIPEKPFAAIAGDVLNRASLRAAMDGVETLVCVLGTAITIKPVSLLSEGTENLISAMRHSAVKRLICITGMGAGDSRGHGGFVYDRIILPTLLKNIYADKNRQEEIVRNSGLDWVLVRPARLTNEPLRAQYREISRFDGETMSTISRADVAHFVVRELCAPRFHNVAVNLSY